MCIPLGPSKIKNIPVQKKLDGSDNRIERNFSPVGEGGSGRYRPLPPKALNILVGLALKNGVSMQSLLFK